MTYTVSARELTGTPTQVVAQLDELIVALMAVRNTLAYAPEATARHTPAAHARAAMLLLALATGVLAAAALASGVLA